jgi:hypothetical protein
VWGKECDARRIRSGKTALSTFNFEKMVNHPILSKEKNVILIILTQKDVPKNQAQGKKHPAFFMRIIFVSEVRFSGSEFWSRSKNLYERGYADTDAKRCFDQCCASETATGMHSESGSRSDSRSGSDIKWSSKSHQIKKLTTLNSFGFKTRAVRWRI